MGKIQLKYGIGIFILFTAFNLFYLFVVNFITVNTQYNFLVWNLFLGFVPYLVALVLKYYLDKLNRIILLIGSFLWLLFYPNAPYMITDLIHVNENSSRVIYEALMIFSFAMESLFFGFYSLKLIESILLQNQGRLKVRIFLISSILLSSFGIYLGRILRLNSWDVFSSPVKTFEMILDHLFPITKNPTTYSMIILFSCIQLILLATLRKFNDEK